MTSGGFEYEEARGGVGGPRKNREGVGLIQTDLIRGR